MTELRAEQDLLRETRDERKKKLDDMKKQPNWPEGHEEKANELVKTIEKRKDITITKMDWSTGLIVAVKK